MKILVTGYTGQLGFDLVRRGLKLRLNRVGIGSKDLDHTNLVKVNDYVKKMNPYAIIYCAAYTAVD
jgi:dTDP-4-dehydrorhamnose reductase